MKIQIIQIAETRDKNIFELEREYEKRLSPFADLEMITLNASKFDDERARAQESDLIMKKFDKDFFVIALDERGKEMTSPEFAELIREKRDFGPGKIQFIIGGSHGLDDSVRKHANFVMGFSKMTFTHEMVRIFLKEQIYRAFAILTGKTYHK